MGAHPVGEHLDQLRPLAGPGPTERGAAASLGTFFSLVLNALLAGIVTPLVSASLVTVGLTSAGFALLGTGMWMWHLASSRRREAV